MLAETLEHIDKRTCWCEINKDVKYIRVNAMQEGYKKLEELGLMVGTLHQLIFHTNIGEKQIREVVLVYHAKGKYITNKTHGPAYDIQAKYI